MGGPEATLTVEQVMLVHVFNQLRGMSWQLAGDKKAPRPKPFLLPGMDAGASGERLGSDPIPMADFNEWWTGATTAEGDA